MTVTCLRWQCSAASRTAVVLAGCLTLGRPTIGSQPSPVPAARSPERISINDNRTPAGTQSDGVLTLRLEARLGTWHPDRDTDPGVVVKAFGVESGPLQIPGPIIRVREGTEIRVRVRNSLDESLALHGLYSRPSPPSNASAVVIRPAPMGPMKAYA